MPDIKQTDQQIFLFLQLLPLSKCHDSALAELSSLLPQKFARTPDRNC
jgi:hypothetical protein